MSKGFEEYAKRRGIAKESMYYGLMRESWEAAQFALNNELGVAANEAAKAARLGAFMQRIVTQDMVPLPVERISEWAKELLG